MLIEWIVTEASIVAVRAILYKLVWTDSGSGMCVHCKVGMHRVY